MLDYKSMSNEELRHVLADAGAELLSRTAEIVPVASKQHSYRIAMPRTSKAEPEAFRFTPVGGDVIRIPLLLDQVIGKTGKLIGGEYLLDDGDVIQKIYASGMVLYLIAWQGNLDRQDYDVGKVLEGETEAETIAKIGRFVRGDRTLLIQELKKAIASWREQVAEYQEMGKTDDYWRELAERNRQRRGILEGMLEWARSTSNSEDVDESQPYNSMLQRMSCLNGQMQRVTISGGRLLLPGTLSQEYRLSEPMFVRDDSA
jgi:hypothetical protein